MVAVAALAVATAPAPRAAAVTQTTTTGQAYFGPGINTWTVPVGTTGLDVTVAGAAASGGANFTLAGGLCSLFPCPAGGQGTPGNLLEFTVPVGPGTTIQWGDQLLVVAGEGGPFAQLSYFPGGPGGSGSENGGNGGTGGGGSALYDQTAGSWISIEGGGGGGGGGGIGGDGGSGTPGSGAGAGALGADGANCASAQNSGGGSGGSAGTATDGGGGAGGGGGCAPGHGGGGAGAGGGGGGAGGSGGNFFSSSTTEVNSGANDGNGYVDINYTQMLPVLTTTSVTSSANPSTYGHSVTFTATVSPSDGAGKVAFYADNSSTAISGCDGASLTLVSGSTYQATCSTSSLSPGNHPISATYSGDTDFATSTGTLTNGQTVNQVTTSTSVKSSTNPSVYGQAVTFKATVSPTDDGGAVAFYADGSSTSISGCGTQSLDSSGVASCTVSSLAVGSHPISASYSGDNDYASSAGSLAIDQGVDKADTTLALSPSANPAPFGAAVTFTATVSPKTPSTSPPSAPSGAIPFTVDGSVLASPTLHANGTQGQATLTTSTLSPGPHTISVSYGGDGNFNGSGPTTVTETITCDHTVTGPQYSALTFSGGTWCVSGATMHGNVTIAPGTSASFSNSTVSGRISATNGAAFSLCGSHVMGSVRVSGASGFVLLGDPGDDACAGNFVGGSVTLSSDHAGVELGQSSVGGSVTLNGNSGATTLDDAHPEVEANTVHGGLACSGDTPAAIDDGQHNTVDGTRSGECGAPGF